MLLLGEEEDDANIRSSALLRHLRYDTKLSDAVIIVDDEPFPIHRGVVVPYSDFFTAALCGVFSEAQENKLVLKDTTKEAVSVALDYMYGSTIEHKVTGDLETGLEVWKLAHRLQMEHLRALTARAVITALTTERSIEVLEHTELYGNDAEVDRVLNFVSRNLNVVVRSCIRFEQIDESHLDKILSNIDLVATEHEKFSAVMRWVGAQRAERIRRLDKLLKNVELERYDPTLVHQVLSNPDIPRDVLAPKVAAVLPTGLSRPLPNILGSGSVIPNDRTPSYAVEEEYLFTVSKDRITLGTADDVTAADNAVCRFNFKHWAMSALLGHEDGKGLFLYLRFDHRIPGADERLSLAEDCQKYAFRLVGCVFCEGYSRKERLWGHEPCRQAQRMLSYELLYPCELPKYFEDMDSNKEFEPISLMCRLQCSYQLEPAAVVHLPPPSKWDMSI